MSKPLPGKGQEFWGALPGSDEWCNKQSHSMRQNHDPLLRPPQPLTPAEAPRGHVGPWPAEGRAVEAPAARVIFALPPTLHCVPPGPERHRRDGAGGGAYPAAPLPPGVRGAAGKLSEGATSSPGPAGKGGEGGDVRCREGGVKAGKRQLQPPPPPAARRPFKPWARGWRERR